MQRLVIIETDDTGAFAGIVREILTDCTVSEWELMEVKIRENAEKSRLFSENEARLSLLLKGLAAAGLFHSNQIDLTGVLQPFVEQIMAQAEQKKGIAAKFEAWKKKTRAKIVGSLWKRGLNLVTKWGSEFIKSAKQ